MCKCRTARLYCSNLGENPSKLAFQFYTKKHPFIKKFFVPENKLTRTLYKIHNFVNIVGYFPVIGAIAGISRIVLACFKIDSQLNSLKKMEIFRGIIEIIGLGFLMMIADIYHRIELSRVIK